MVGSKNTRKVEKPTTAAKKSQDAAKPTTIPASKKARSLGIVVAPGLGNFKDKWGRMYLPGMSKYPPRRQADPHAIAENPANA